MKNSLFSLAFVLFSLYAIAQANQNWYKVFTGKAGNLATVLHLHKSGNNYSGYVWFEQNQRPMQVYGGYPIAKTDSIMISTGSAPFSLVLTGVFTETGFAGKCSLEKDGSPAKQSAFELQVSSDKKLSLFTYYAMELADSIPPKYKNDSRLSYFASAIWPGGNNQVLEEALKKFIRRSLEIKNPALDPGKWMTDQKKLLLAGWKETYIKLTPKDAAELGLSLSSSTEQKLLVMHEQEKSISLAHYYFAEGGGAAHGNFNTTVATFNKQSGKQLQVTDILNAQGIKLLPVILEQVARTMYGVKNNRPLDENGFLVKKIDPTKNIYITGSGIGFIYAPYEIKPFSDGEVNLLVPFAALKPYLLPGVL